MPVAIPIVIPVASIVLIKILRDRQNLSLTIWNTWKFVHQWWVCGRPYFKALHWGIKAKDNLNKFGNITNVSVVESWQEPFRSCYKFGLWVYPDNDSNYARAASVVLQIGENGRFFTNKVLLTAGVNAFAVTYETIKSEYIVKRVAMVLDSSTATCKYNISTGDKEYLKSLQNIWPVGHTIIHSFGERMLTPFLYTDWNNALKAQTALFLGGTYFAQDFTGFKFIERDIQAVLDYVNANSECVYSLDTKISDTQAIEDL
jgi:hypothetical protein